MDSFGGSEGNLDSPQNILTGVYRNKQTKKTKLRIA